MPDFWNDSQHRPNFLEDVQISEAEKNAWLSQLLRNLATLQRQRLNQIRDVAAYRRLPIGAQLAMERQVGSDVARGLEQGLFDINKFATTYNKDAFKWLLSMAQQQRFQEEARRDKWLDLLGQLGGSIGQLAAGKFIFG